MDAAYPVITTPEIRSLRLFDADALSETVRSSCLEHSQLGPGDFQAELRRIDIGRLTLDFGCYTRKLLARGDFPSDRVILGCVLDSREAGCINGYRLSRHDVVIFPEGAELDYILPAATSWCSVQLSKTLLEEAGCAAITFDRVKVLPANRPANARLARLLGGLVSDHAPEAGAAGPGLSFSPTEEIVLEQIRDTLNDHLAGRRNSRGPSLHNRMLMVRQFEHTFRERIETVVQIPELCTELGVSQRTLENLFKAEIGMTPKQFSNVLRLNAIRRKLLRTSIDNETIAIIANRYGITHLGRFSAAYLRQFGELPSETLRGNQTV